MDEFYRKSNGNAHRGMHPLAEAATEALESSRERIRSFLEARNPEEIIFTKSCTEAINLVAKSLSQLWKPGDAVVTTELEHHSNIVPWLQLKERGIDVRWIPCNKEGELDCSVLEKHLADKKVRLVAVTAQSNVVGVRPDLGKIIELSHKSGALVLIDAAQSIAHTKMNVAELDCDFLVFSGHKLYGPLGIGVLYGKREILEKMPPFLGGGMMIREVTQEGFSPADLPQKFEAGTQPIAEAVGLRAAIDWLSQFSWKEIEEHEQGLLEYAQEKLSRIDDLTILARSKTNNQKLITNNFPSSCLSFTIEGVHPHDLTDIVGKEGICLRAGHHCAQPLHKRLGVTASTRLSVALYNTKEDIDRAVIAIQKAVEFLKR